MKRWMNKLGRILKMEYHIKCINENKSQKQGAEEKNKL